ncbi:hypothetical protein CFC21_091153 [Triticum aestivum]|uniref:F-box protein AT5G49610-like beta-propeller domain-containing protein n=2 Tax=Triticum aestivum TaxID=4565 RepID=A0A3B6QCC9_WHEAT|nr:uncharacterized protein LOC123140853 [Triticum aestivum]KAF7087996.1 hypothetical protein CFC21_091153 [Triticum aestivum]
MGGGAADQGKTREDPRVDPGILDQRRHSSPRLLPSRHGFQEMASLPIPDELVAEIFLRLPTPADVIRASGACVSFRRLVAGRPFLRRFRKLHDPPLLGFLALTGAFFPVLPPSPSASAASAVALAADFSFSFLPVPARDWKVRDARGGRVLLSRSPLDNSLAVCDPLHRRYLLLPLIPEVEGWAPHSFENPQRRSFLLDAEEAAGETSFTVICIAHWGDNDKQGAFVFSSSTGQWRSTPWIAGFASFSGYRHAYGCFYGVTACREKLLVLDTQRMEFSLADLPPQVRGSSEQIAGISIVEAGEGVTGMFVLPYYTSHISYLIRRNNGGTSSQWQLEKTIPLVSSWYSFMGSTERHFLLVSQGDTFTLDIKTFQLEKVVRRGISSPCVYRNFPPSLLSSPTISSGVETEDDEMLEKRRASSSSP